MFRKISLRKIEEEKPLRCYRVRYWKGVEQRYAMIAAIDTFDAEERFRCVYPRTAVRDIIDIYEVKGK